MEDWRFSFDLSMFAVHTLNMANSYPFNQDGYSDANNGRYRSYSRDPATGTTE